MKNGFSQVASVRNPQSGFTLFELIVVVVIISILAATFLNRVMYYQEQAEKTAMVEVAAAIQTSLILQYGQMLIHGREREVSTLAVENPMNWLLKKPPNYAGEFFAPTPASVHSGNWVFDLKSRELIYIPSLTGHLAPGKDGYKWIRYRVALKYEPAYGASGGTANPREFIGVLFEQVEPNLWSL
jgi:prepilin-type N-terminal cleavage/methylation domain-containing protein